MTKAVELAQVASTGVSEAFKNRIINGAMRIDQRNSGAQTNSATNNGYTLDRWATQNNSGASRFTVQQNANSVTPPTGYSNYLGCVSSGAYTPASGDAIGMIQRIEGNNVADFGWGASGAQPVTLSFWVRSSLTGTFGGSFFNGDGNYSYPFTYTISSANTWEQKSITVTGPTAGNWPTNNATCINVLFALGTGSSLSGPAGSWSGAGYYGANGQTQWVSTNGATFYITGVQLEVGSSATSFETRSYGTELALCQRYCFGFGGGSSGGTSCVMGLAFSGNQSVSVVQFPVTMRGYPSLTVATPSNFYTNNLGANTNSSTLTANTTSATTGEFFATLVSSALTTGQAIRFFGNNTSLAIWSAEL